MLILFFSDEWNRFYRPKPLKIVLVCKIDKNDIITLKLCKTIELIKYNVCAKYEPSTKWTMPGIKEKKIMVSSLQSPFEPDLQNTNQLIKTAVVNLLSWRFHNWLGIIKSPSCESLKMFWLAERILLTKSWKIVLLCKIHKNDVIRLKLCQNVQLFVSACNMNILPVLDFELLRKNNFMISFLSGL